MPVLSVTDLNEIQKQEFPTDLLQTFAVDYLNFQRSSPCTAKRRRYAYFLPPDEKTMSEDDILFGPDREIAYEILMRSFRACRQRREFDRYFNEKKSLYFESETIPGLVVTKEMLAQTRLLPPGLYPVNYYQERRLLGRYSEAWICMRSMPKNVDDFYGNIKLIPELAPSRSLLLKYLNWKKTKTWNDTVFQTKFAPEYLKEMLQPEPLRLLRELNNKIKTEPVAILCTCADENLCHRSLIAKIVNQINGAETKQKGESEP